MGYCSFKSHVISFLFANLKGRRIDGEKWLEIFLKKLLNCTICNEHCKEYSSCVLLKIFKKSDVIKYELFLHTSANNYDVIVISEHKKVLLAQTCIFSVSVYLENITFLFTPKLRKKDTFLFSYTNNPR